MHRPSCRWEAMQLPTAIPIFLEVPSTTSPSARVDRASKSDSDIPSLKKATRLLWVIVR